MGDEEGFQQFVISNYRRVVNNITSFGMTGGIANVVGEIGQALQQYFPYDRGTDKNELPDDIVFGR